LTGEWRFIILYHKSGKKPRDRSASIVKIKLDREKIIRAVKKLAGIELVLQNEADGKEAVELVLGKSELRNHAAFGKLKDVKVTLLQEYKTSAVDYQTLFLIEFLFEEGIPIDQKASFIEEFQRYFNSFPRS
jgi:hypothetical protein